MVAELWEGRGLGSWLNDSTPQTFLYAACSWEGRTTRALWPEAASLVPHSAHALPTAGSHTREQRFRKICKDHKSGQARPGWLTPSALVSYQEEAPGVVWEDRTQERKADRHIGSEDQTERAETHPAGAGRNTLRCPVDPGGGWGWPGCSPHPDSPRQ